MSDESVRTRHYFVDEAGDAVLFGARGSVRVETDGCSRHFAVGLLDVADATGLAADLLSLRADLLADPYFAGVPSMRPEARRTALFFHAKNDPPEVRREVFRLLQGHAVKFSAVVRDKRVVLESVRERNLRESSYRYHPNELYDHTVRRLFLERLNRHDGYDIRFAARGTGTRTAAFRTAIEEARNESQRGRRMVHRPLDVRAAQPADEAGLQAVDYFLWALQRAYERGEDRFLALLWPQCSMVVDADDTRGGVRGTYYTRQRPLRAAALKGELRS